jgi:hypothetical protein
MDKKKEGVVRAQKEANLLTQNYQVRNKYLFILVFLFCFKSNLVLNHRSLAPFLLFIIWFMIRFIFPESYEKKIY